MELVEDDSGAWCRWRVLRDGVAASESPAFDEGWFRGMLENGRADAG